MLRMRFAMTMPHLMSCSSSWTSKRFVSSRASVVGMVTTEKELRSGSVKSSWSSIIRNWKDRTWSGPSLLPESHPKRSRSRATRSASRSRKSGYVSSRTAWPVGAVSMMIRSNFSFSTLSSTSVNATISSLPGGSVSKRSTKSCIGSWFSTWPTMPPSDCRCCNASRTVSWKRFMAAAVSTSMAKSSPAPVKLSTGCAEAESLLPKASPRECAGSVEMISTRWPSVAAFTAIAEDMDVLPTPPFPPKSVTWVVGIASPNACMARNPKAGGPTKFSGRSPTSYSGSDFSAQTPRSEARTCPCDSTRAFQ
mmetsp:Transcript_30154/g.56573  ORF Transcript_30154/g.56573 Transcript_30154/m.56573 type:complete len:308 (+) Transcript_30154:185-1108(+)